MRRLVALVVLFGAFACGSSSDSSTGPAAIVVTGAWQLKTVNGTALPFGSTSGTVKTEITGDALSLNADGTWSEATNYRVTQGVTVTTTIGASIGVYRSTNGAVQFTQTTPSSSTFNGTVSGNTLTVLLGAGTFVYQR